MSAFFEDLGMTPEEYSKWFHSKLDLLTGKQYLDEWFDTDELEAFVKERSLRRTDWDDPVDWVNGVTIGLSFHFREYLPDMNSEAKFRMQVAMFLTELIWRIDFHER